MPRGYRNDGTKLGFSKGNQYWKLPKKHWTRPDLIEKNKSFEHRNKVSEKLKGHLVSMETREKIRLARIILFPPIKKLCPGCQKEFINKKHKEAIFCSRSCQNRILRPSATPQARKKISEKKIKFLRENPEKHLNYILSKNQKNMKKSTEKPIYDLLIALGIHPQYNFLIYPYWIDFFITPNICIECDGSYWHQSKEKELKRDNFLKSKGFKVIHFSEEQIRNNIDLCKKILLDELNLSLAENGK